MRLGNEQVRGLLLAHGAREGSQSGMVRFPRRMVQEALAGTPPEDFPIPERVVLVPIDMNANGGCVRPVTMAFVAGTEPKETCGPARYAPGVSPPRTDPPLLPTPSAPAPAMPSPASPQAPQS